MDTVPSAAEPAACPHERAVAGAPGRPVLAGCGAALAAGIAALVTALRPAVTGHGGAAGRAGLLALSTLLVVAGITTLRGLVAVAPGEAVVVQLFGGYLGTVRRPGLRWIRPWAARRGVSVKIRTFQTPPAKVNDADGNPVEISVVTTWQVTDTARAVFAVDDVTAFVRTQVEVAARQTAMSYPYDDHGSGKACLRASAPEISAILAADIAERVAPAGVRVLETRIARLSYAPEIAHAMLRRQQAEAVVAARLRIVEGAVGMVEGALARLATDGVVDFDEDRKAAMVSNMLVVLCSDHATQPVVNTGTIYQ